ncbi:MAG: hypothetical protein ACI4JM_03055 [Oscillospiraceae bacterium]
MEAKPIDSIADRSILEKRLMSTGNAFIFFNNKCDCLLDIRHNDDGAKFYELKFRSNDNENIYFAYNKDGLVCNEKNALVDLLSLRDENVDEVKNYFDNYGFLFPVTSKSYTSFKYDDIVFVTRRIKYTVKILSMLSSQNFDYSQLLFMVSYLLFNSIQIGSIYNSPVTPMKEYVDNPFSIPEIPYDPSDPDVIIMEQEEHGWYTKDSDDGIKIGKTIFDVPRHAFVVPDRFLKSKENTLFFEDYEKSIRETESELSSYYNAIVYLFRNYNDTNCIWREFIEFFFHIQHDVEPITKFDVKKMELFDDMSKKIAPFFENKLFQEGLKDIAQMTVKFELDEMLKGITPKYDIQNMSPTWKIDNLVTALYFSIFYHNFNVSIFKKCYRENCWKYFEVSSTNSKKKYCCVECQNIDAQKRHRRKTVK